METSTVVERPRSNALKASSSDFEDPKLIVQVFCFAAVITRRDGAVPGVDMSRFKQVSFQYDQVHASGGLLKRALPVTTKTVGAGVANQTTIPWSKEQEEHDPMDDVDVSDSESPSKKVKSDGGSRMRYHRNDYKKSIVEIEIPEHPPEVAKDGQDVRTIRLYIEDRKKVWLHIDDLSWAIKWMYVQIELKGVPLVAPDSAVQALHVTHNQPTVVGRGQGTITCCN